MKTNLNILFLLLLIGVLTSTDVSARRHFDKSKDLLLANFDLRPDKDDIHASAALACMLKHPDFSGVKYFVTVGAVGTQNCQQFRKPNGIPAYFTAMFGNENQKWTNAFVDWNSSVTRAKNKVVATINAGGKVFVQEGGPSEFTRDVLEAVNQQGISLTKIKNRVTVVQHSIYNEGWTTGGTKQWIRNNTDYVKIADGNSQNATPDYCKHGNWLNRAKNNNPNSFAKNIWTRADSMVKGWDNSACHNNDTMNDGGVDMSDCVENWWIFNLGNKADSMTKFWDRYVTNGGSGSSGDSNQITLKNLGNNKYVSSEDGLAPMNCNRNTAGDWEKFTLEDLGNGKYAIKGNNGKYVSSENGVKKMNCNRSSVGAWEKFTFVDKGNNNFIIKGSNGKNVSSGMRCNSTATNSSVQFKIAGGLKSASLQLNTEVLSEDKGFEIYPTKVSNTVYIRTVKNEDCRILVYSINGQLMLNKKINTKVGVNSVDVSELKNGTYILKVQSKEVGHTTKLLKIN